MSDAKNNLHRDYFLFSLTSEYIITPITRSFTINIANYRSMT